MHKQGYTLIEMMISIALGLIIILFVSNLYLSSKESYRINQDYAQLMQDGRSVMALLGRNLTQAGFGNPVGLGDQTTSDAALSTDFNYPVTTPARRAFSACDNGFARLSDMTDFSCSTSSANVGRTAFHVSYRGDKLNTNSGAGTDCNGQKPSVTGDVIVNRFYLTISSGSTTKTLNCLGNGNTAFAQPLLNNVEDMRLTYGVDTNGDQVADYFVNTATAAQSTGIDFKNVVSVAICLQISSTNSIAPVASQASKPQVFTDCNGTRQTASATDRKLHAVLSSVFTLRNRAASSLYSYE